MMNGKIWSFFILLLPAMLTSQWTENFSSDLSGWSGDLDKFIINSDQELQLQDINAGSATILREINLPENWASSIYLHMDFAPSASNRLLWYIAADQQEVKNANAIYLVIGENGSGDALRLYQKKDGVESLLATGTAGAVASDAIARINIEVSGESWTISADYAGGFLPMPEIQIDIPDSPNGDLWMALFCQYSSSRSDKFFFDDISYGILTEDTEAPQLVDYEIILPSTISLTFNELLDETLSAFTENYVLEPAGQMPQSVTATSNVVLLDFISLPENAIFRLSYQGVTDLNGNMSSIASVDSLYVSMSPQFGDLLISEILFNPVGDGSDYVELYNNSDKILQLTNLEIKNTYSDRSTFMQRAVLFPHQYIAISEDASTTIIQYQPPAEAFMVVNDLPPFNNDEGNITIQYEGEILDAFDYSEDFHSPIITDPDGVSLERIFLDQSADENDNWTSGVSTTNFGTPGYKNASTIEPGMANGQFSLRHTTFSPDGNGDKDLLLIDHDLDKSNYSVSIDIYNDQGFKVRQLYNNRTIPASGSLVWDGLGDDGQELRLGVYIIRIQAFHSDGETTHKKMGCVLARVLD